MVRRGKGLTKRGEWGLESSVEKDFFKKFTGMYHIFKFKKVFSTSVDYILAIVATTGIKPTSQSPVHLFQPCAEGSTELGLYLWEN